MVTEPGLGFGVGIVETEEDFGSQGLLPSHPAMLDWLAVDFIENGWSLKQLLRGITLSRTYRQDSAFSGSPTREGCSQPTSEPWTQISLIRRSGAGSGVGCIGLTHSETGWSLRYAAPTSGCLEIYLQRRKVEDCHWS